MANKWDVFPNPDGDVGGWYSYAENETHYIGGSWHKTRKEAEAYAHHLAASAPTGGKPVAGEVFAFVKEAARDE